MTDYLFQLPDKRTGTLQTQIQEMMVRAILSQQLPAGCLLPSGRKLAQQLNVSRNTVVLAYLNLMDEGFINSRERRGFFVCEDVLSEYAKVNYP
jgi:GntR family transcriptional regulator/MocR family aminotransferase